MNWEWVNPSELRPNPKNPNMHSPEQIDRLAQIIDHYGWRHPIIVSNQSGYIVVGHGRLDAAKRMKLEKVPIEYQDFETPDLEYGFLVCDNGIARQAELNLAQINIDMIDLGPMDIDLLGIKDFTIEPLDKLKDGEEIPKKSKACPNCGFTK